MNRSIALLALLALGCTATTADKDDDTDTTDSDTVDTDTDTVDTVDTDDTTPDDTDDTDGVDTEVSNLAPSYVLPPEAEDAVGGVFQEFGLYGHTQMVVTDPTHLPDVPFEITAVRFRWSSFEDDADSTLDGAAVRVWIGHAASAAMSNTFADNRQGTQQLILDAAVDFAMVGTDPLAFDDWVLPVSPPFAYDPATGPLLLEFAFATPGEWVRLDCRNDGKLQMRMSFAAGEETGPVATGCGYVFELMVQ